MSAIASRLRLSRSPRAALLLVPILALGLLLALGGAAPAAETGRDGLSRGQTLYLPAYAQVFYDQKGNTMDLAITLSVRNTDPGLPIILESVALYDAAGKLVSEYMKTPKALAPLTALKLPVPQKPSSLPGGPSFILRWRADRPVNLPLAQCVMIGASGQQGISFLTDAYPLFNTGK